MDTSFVSSFSPRDAEDLHTLELFVGDEFRGARRHPGGPGLITPQTMQAIIRALEQVIYCHAGDVDHPWVRTMKEIGYRVEVSELVMAGRVYVRNPARLALVDLATGQSEYRAVNNTIRVMEG